MENSSINTREKKSFANERIIRENTRLLTGELKRLGFSDDVVVEKIKSISKDKIHFSEDDMGGDSGTFSGNTGDIRVSGKMDIFTRVNTLLHESVHALSSVNEKVGLRRGNFWIGINEGLTEHMSRKLFQESFCSREKNFSVRYENYLQRHGYSPYVDVWEEWFLLLAKERSENGGDFDEEYIKVRDEVYKYFMSGKPELIFDFINQNIAPGGEKIFESVQPKNYFDSDLGFDDHIHRRKARLDLERARRQIVLYRQSAREKAGKIKSPEQDGVLSKKISEPYLEKSVVDPASLAAKYQNIIESKMGSDFFKTLPTKKLNVGDIVWISHIQSSMADDVRIMKANGEDSGNLENFQFLLDTFLAFALSYRLDTFVKVVNTIKSQTNLTDDFWRNALRLKNTIIREIESSIRRTTDKKFLLPKKFLDLLDASLDKSKH